MSSGEAISLRGTSPNTWSWRNWVASGWRLRALSRNTSTLDVLAVDENCARPDSGEREYN